MYSQPLNDFSHPLHWSNNAQNKSCLVSRIRNHVVPCFQKYLYSMFPENSSNTHVQKYWNKLAMVWIAFILGSGWVSMMFSLSVMSCHEFWVVNIWLSCIILSRWGLWPQKYNQDNCAVGGSSQGPRTTIYFDSKEPSKGVNHSFGWYLPPCFGLHVHFLDINCN